MANLDSSLLVFLKSIADSEPFGVISSIDEVWKDLSNVTLPALGPLVLGANLLLDERVVKHSTTSGLVQAAKEQHKIYGDGANLVVSIAWQHFEGAKELMEKDGLKPSHIIHGYEQASKQVDVILKGLVKTMNRMSKDEVVPHLKESLYKDKDVHLSSKDKDILYPLIAEACTQVCPQNQKNFNVDNVRVAKLLGVNRDASTTFRGMVLKVDTIVGSIKTIENAKVLVVAGGVDTAGTKTHRVYTDEELESYAQSEEGKGILHSGAKVIVSGADVGLMAHQFCNVNKIMVLKITSENEFDCFCRTTDAVALSELKSSVVDPSYLGKVDSISVEKTHGDRVTVTKKQGCVATVLLGLESPNNIYYEQLERAVVKGVKIYKALCMDSRFVPGAGATEIEIAKQLKEFSLKNGSADAIAIAKYAESFELIPKTLAKNSHLDVENIMNNLKADHEAGKVEVGIDVKEGACEDASILKIWDLYTTKHSALKFATKEVCKALELVEKAGHKGLIVANQDPEHHLLSKVIDFVKGTRAQDLENQLSNILKTTLQAELKNKELKWLAVNESRDEMFGLSQDRTLYVVDKLTNLIWSQEILVSVLLDAISNDSLKTEVHSSFIIISSLNGDGQFHYSTEHDSEDYHPPFKYSERGKWECEVVKTVSKIWVDHEGRTQYQHPKKEMLCVEQHEVLVNWIREPTSGAYSYVRILHFEIFKATKEGKRMGEVDGGKSEVYDVPGKHDVNWRCMVPKNDGTKVEVEQDIGVNLISILRDDTRDESHAAYVHKFVDSIKKVSDENVNVLKVHRVTNSHKGYRFSVQSFGTPLRIFIDKKSLNEKQKLEIIRGIINGVRGLHAKGIAIGDLSIDHVFVNEDLIAKVSAIIDKKKFPSKTKGTQLNLIASTDNATKDDLKADMLGVRNIVFFCYTGEIYQEHDMHRTKSLSVDGLHLLQIIMKGATAKALSSHPIFWPGWKANDFIRAVIDYLEDGKELVRKDLESIKWTVLDVHNKWGAEFPDEFLEVMEKFSYAQENAGAEGSTEQREHEKYKKMQGGAEKENEKYRKYSVYSLFHIARNYITHEETIKRQLATYQTNKMVEMLNQEFHSFIKKKFPRLINDSYEVLETRLKNIAKFSKFYHSPG